MPAWSFANVSSTVACILSRRRRLHISSGIWLFQILLWMLLNHIDAPLSPSYISSFIGNPLDAEHYYWLYYLSIFIQMTALLPILLIFDHFYIFYLTFSQSICNILQILTSEAFEENNKRFISTLQLAICHYQKVEKLVKQFNATFRWLFLVYKVVTLINFCILIFVPLRGYAIFSGVGFTAFFVSFLFFTWNIGTLLPSIGAVFKMSEEFKREWFKKLGNEDNYFRELKCCYKFGFEVGSFYLVHEGSILIFFSIATSYLIVLLQLDIKV